MRTSNSIKNISIGVLAQLIIAILGFISRKVFLDSLGTQYLGVNALLTNVLSMLALVESGIGISIVYNLYKPLAENNKPKIIAFVQLYRKVYAALAVILFALSIALYPFLGIFIKGDATVPYITIAYFIFVAKNITYYLNAHRISLIGADQKKYVLESVNLVFKIFMMLAKIMILISTGSYLLFLGVELVTSIVEQVYSGIIVNKRYPYIKTKVKYAIDKIERDSLIKNVKALFFHNIGSYAVFGTDNLLIASFVGVITVGLYSNYTMIIGQLGMLVTPLIAGIGASVGNLIATENSEKKYSIFKVSYLANFWIYSICVIFLYNLLEPFINWWLGEGFLLGGLTFIVILINFYLTGLRSSILTFKTKGGIFVQDKYVPLIGAAINLGISIILVNKIGLVGVFIGTTISTLCVFWVGPVLVFNHIFKVSVWVYFIQFVLFAFLTVTVGFITTVTCNFLVNGEGFLSLVERGLICLAIPNMIYIAIFYKTKEFQYIKRVVIRILSGVKVKLASISQAKA